MKLGSLFSGAAGLDRAVETVFGATTAWHCELDSAASKVLAHRYPGVPNLGDITAVDWDAVEPVDILCGGYPCQPFSAAGQRKGTTDERHLWPHFAGAIRRIRPSFVVLENVAGHRSMGFDSVLGDLAEIGYDAQWCSVRASDVGAPHRRERLFVVAHPRGDRLERDEELHGGQIPGRKTVSGGGHIDGCDVETQPGQTVAVSSGVGWDEGWPEPARLIGGSDAAVSGDGPVELLPTPTSRDHKGGNQRGDETCLPGALLPTPAAADGQRGQDLARANRDGSGGDDLVTLVVKADRDNRWGKYGPAIAHWEQATGPAPNPTEPNRNGNPRLNPAFSEWMMGWPSGWVTDVPGVSRNDALRIIGNGVVPQQAAMALRWLLTVAVAA